MTDKKRVAILTELLNTDEFEQYFDVALKMNDALILTTFGSGSLPDRYIEKVRQSVHDGKPIFLLVGTNKTSSIEGEKSAGITGVTYGTQQNMLEAGAVHIESVNKGHYERALAKESARPKDNVLEVITSLAEETDDMFEWIRKVRELYNLTDDEISFLEEASKVDSAPIEREKILKSRRELNDVLSRIEQEVGSERTKEIRPQIKLK